MHVSKENVFDVVGASDMEVAHQHIAPFRARFAEFRARFGPPLRN